MEDIIFDILIIGFGAAALSFLYQLNAKSHLLPKQITTIGIIDPSKNIGIGYAYHVQSSELLLNTRIESMGITPENQLHFKQWLEKNNLSNKDFLPRNIFASYLEDNLKHLIKETELKITFIAEEAINCTMQGYKKTLVQTSKNTYFAKRVLFAHGGSLQSFSKECCQLPNFVRDIYDEDAPLQRIQEGAKVLLLGSNLTMIDACILLRQENKQFDLSITSRSGYFPSRRAPHVDYAFGSMIVKETKNFLATSEINAETLTAFLDKLLSAYFGEAISINNLIGMFEVSIREKTSCNLFDYHDKYDLSPISTFLDDSINQIWRYLSLYEQGKIYRVTRYLLRFICAIPEENIRKAKEMFLSESRMKIKILDKIQMSHSKFQVSFKPKDDTFIEYDYLINCTGIGGYYHPENNHALAKCIIKNKQLCVNSSYGLLINEKQQVIASVGAVPHSNVFAIGEATIGSHFIRSSFSYYADQARIVVEEILRQCSHL